MNTFSNLKLSASNSNYLYFISVVLLFHLSATFKINENFPCFCFKDSFEFLNKIKLSSLENPFTDVNVCDIYFIPYHLFNLCFIGQKKMQLKYKIDDYYWKRRNQGLLAVLLLLIASLIIIIFIFLNIYCFLLFIG